MSPARGASAFVEHLKTPAQASVVFGAHLRAGRGTEVPGRGSAILRVRPRACANKTEGALAVNQGARRPDRVTGGVMGKPIDQAST